MRLIAAVSMAVVLAATAPGEAQEPGYKVIVHPANAGTVIKKPVLSGIFMGKNQRWGDGSPIVPVDQSAQSAVRAKFVKDVMNQSVAAVMAYWARQMMSGGARPPVVKASDREVIDFVVKTPGAIGYVAPETTLPGTVKALTVE
jgi:ABC-type phosphate transport system substrate-binding protein